MRYFLHHAYHGANYQGWQQQEHASSVQGELERCLSILLKQPTEVLGAGRTDTGVHATGNYCHFDTEAPLPPDFLRKLNGMLPLDIAVQQLFEATHPQMHARFSALSRSYCYTLARYKQPMLQDRAWPYYHPLDVAAMQEAAGLLIHYRDFASFCKTGGNNHTTLCTLFESRWEEAPGVLRYHVTANRFLRGMVRALVGTLVLVGEGKLTLNALREVVEAKDRRRAGQAAPAKGLVLVNVGYIQENLKLVQFL